MRTSTGFGGLEASTNRLRNIPRTKTNTDALEEPKVPGMLLFTNNSIQKTLSADHDQKRIERAIDFLRPFAERVEEGKQVKLRNGDEVRFHRTSESDEQQM